jgi:hypothetical protein
MLTLLRFRNKTHFKIVTICVKKHVQNADVYVNPKSTVQLPMVLRSHLRVVSFCLRNRHFNQVSRVRGQSLPAYNLNHY